MRDAKHTPGPWVACEQTQSHGPYVESDVTGKSIADLYFIYPDSRTEFFVHHAEEAFANARLIAAAPDLLEALEGYVRHVETAHPEAAAHESLYQQARKAIAKAKVSHTQKGQCDVRGR